MSKDCELSIRISIELKERVTAEAKLRGESAAVIVREALREYFAAQERAPSFRPELNETHPRYRTHKKKP